MTFPWHLKDSVPFSSRISLKCHLFSHWGFPSTSSLKLNISFFHSLSPFSLYFSPWHTSLPDIFLINFVYCRWAPWGQNFSYFCWQLYKYHRHSRTVPGTELESSEFQTCVQKHGGEREHLFGEMQVILHDLRVEYILWRSKRLSWRSKQGVDLRRLSLILAFTLRKCWKVLRDWSYFHFIKFMLAWTWRMQRGGGTLGTRRVVFDSSMFRWKSTGAWAGHGYTDEENRWNEEVEVVRCDSQLDEEGQ